MLKSLLSLSLSLVFFFLLVCFPWFSDVGPSSSGCLATPRERQVGNAGKSMTGIDLAAILQAERKRAFHFGQDFFWSFMVFLKKSIHQH